MARRANRTRLVLAVPFVLAACGWGGDPAMTPTLSFEATVPAGTTGIVHVTGNLPALGGFQEAGALAMTSVGGSRWTVTVAAPGDGTLVEYKYTLGTWSTVEKASDCAELANRRVAIAGPATVATDTVARWRDSCP